jgi:hypothetical protein
VRGERLWYTTSPLGLAADVAPEKPHRSERAD